MAYHNHDNSDNCNILNLLKLFSSFSLKGSTFSELKYLI